MEQAIQNSRQESVPVTDSSSHVVNKQYAEDIEAEKKRAMRAEQHTTRSSRSIYQLTQQVTAVLHDIQQMAAGLTNRVGIPLKLKKGY